MGLRASYLPERIAPIRKYDPYFLQGASSSNDTFAYFSGLLLNLAGGLACVVVSALTKSPNETVLDAPGNEGNSTGLYVCQMCISWPFRPGFFGQSAPIEFPATSRERLDLARTFARTWAEPFRSLILDLPDGTEVKTLDLADWPPPRALRGCGPVVLMGDAMHQMAMCKFFPTSPASKHARPRPVCLKHFWPGWRTCGFHSCRPAVFGPLDAERLLKARNA